MGIHSETKPKSLQRCWQRDTGAVVLLCCGPGQGEVTSMARATHPWGQSPTTRTCVPVASCGVAAASSQQCPQGANVSIIVACVPWGLLRGVPCVCWGGTAPTLGTAEAGALVGAAKAHRGSCCSPMDLLLLPPATAAKTPPRWLSRAQGPSPASATPSGVSPVPRDSSGTASASS